MRSQTLTVPCAVLLLGVLAAAFGGRPSEEPMNSESTEQRARPIVIAHRGASGYRPEHTLAGYRLAVEMGADYIEPDLVITKDGVLVDRHDNYLSTTTDVANHPEFADRKRKSERFGSEDWWIEDFTLAEIKTLRAVQPFPGRSTEFDGRFEIPSFDEVAALAEELSAQTGRRIGLYPETKNPSYFNSLGLEFEKSLLEILAAHGYGEAGSPVFIQSFEPQILQSLRSKTSLPLVMLLYPGGQDEAGTEIPNLPFSLYADFVDGVGPAKSLLVKTDGSSSGFIEEAHARGLVVHPWTFRSDQLPPQFATPEAEYQFFFSLGVDGVFSDFSDTAVAARDAFMSGK